MSSDITLQKDGITGYSGINVRPNATYPTFTSSTRLTIHTGNVKEKISNASIKFDRPRAKSSRNLGNGPIKYAVDLLKITRAFDVTGYFTIEISGATSIAIQKQRMRDFMRSGGPVLMTYNDGSEETTFIGFIDDVELIEEPADESGALSYLQVSFTFMECTER